MKVSLVSTTQISQSMKDILPSELHTSEGIIAYTARVSSANQENPNYEKLLHYCIIHGHWSPFEMVDMTVEITTSRAIAQQILRHRSFSFQEFSQRYAQATNFEMYEARRQDIKNRQNSIDDLPVDIQQWFKEAQADVQLYSKNRYEEALKLGIAKEQSRFLLPLSTTTKLYMKGSVRSWIHYLQLRCGNGTQLEHMEIANTIKSIFNQQFPTIAKTLEFIKNFE